MAPNPESTRRRLVAAAEELFASRGIDGVSLREINAAAGQRNASALQYHFVDRAGLLAAVLDKHAPSVDAGRHDLLDRFEAGRHDDDDLRALAGALVRPSAAKLADRDGGRAYLRIHAQLVNLVGRPAAERVADGAIMRGSISRWRRLVAPLLDEVAVTRLHHRFAAIRVTATELARRAADTPRRDDGLFTSNLVDLVTAILTARVSPETARLLATRRPGGRG